MAEIIVDGVSTFSYPKGRLASRGGLIQSLALGSYSSQAGADMDPEQLRKLSIEADRLEGQRFAEAVSRQLGFLQKSKEIPQAAAIKARARKGYRSYDFQVAGPGWRDPAYVQALLLFFRDRGFNAETWEYRPDDRSEYHPADTMMTVHW